MPYSRDKRVFEECVKWLSGPPSLHATACVNGRRILDTTEPGQQLFQALLADCLFSRHRSHPWDQMKGRSFSELLSYFGWVCPLPDRLVICTNTPARIANYLLPYTNVFGPGSFEHSGIPGLRVVACRRRAIDLVHLPTGGRLELLDPQKNRHSTPRDMRRTLRLELEMHRDWREEEVGRSPVWRSEELTREERAAEPAWQWAPSTNLRSAMMARAGLFWSTSYHESEFRLARRSDSALLLMWREGRTTTEMGELLTGRAVGIPGAQFELPPAEYAPGVLRLGGTAMEILGPERPKLVTALRRARLPKSRHGRSSATTVLSGS